MLNIKEPLKFEDIAHIRPERPEGAGGTWEGLAHADLSNIVKARAAAAGLGAPTSQEYVLLRGGLNCIGCFRFDGQFVRSWHPQPSIVFLNQNDLRKPLTFYLGYWCDGVGFAVGSLRAGVHSIHTDFNEAYDELELAATRLPDEIRQTMTEQLDAPLTEDQRARAMVRAARGGFVTWARLTYAARDQTASGKAWGALHALGRAAGRAAPFEQPNALAGLRRIFASLIPAAPAA